MEVTLEIVELFEQLTVTQPFEAVQFPALVCTWEGALMLNDLLRLPPEIYPKVTSNWKPFTELT